MSRHRRGAASTLRLRALLAAVLAFAVTAGLGAAAHPAMAAATLRVMTIGDSITQGDDGDYTWRYRLWQHLTQTSVAVDFVGDYRTPKQGRYAVDGWDSDHQASWGMPAWMQKDVTQEAVARHSPDLIVLHIGTNDLAFGGEPSTAVNEVRAIITAARAGRPSVKFLLMKIIPRDGTENSVTEDFNNRVASMAATESTTASPIAVGDAYTGVDPQDDLYDGTHPNRIGEQKLAAAVARGLAQSFGIGTPYTVPTNQTSGPDTPGGVTVTGGDSTATVAWSPVRTATSYNIYARDRTDSGSSFALVQFGVTATTWQQTMLWNGHEYEYRVAAVRWFDESPPSASVRVVPAAPTPATPGGVALSAARNTVTVRWNAVAGVESYSVYSRDVTADGQFRQVQFNVTGTSWTQTLLTSGHVYAYYVTSVRRGMESEPSVTSEIEVEPEPDAPRNVRASGGDGRVTISWSATDGATSYRVFARDATAGDSFQLVQWNLTQPQWTQVLLVNGHRYEYYVTAINGGSESPKSVTVAATPHAQPPAAPANLTAAASGTSISLSWSSVPGVSNYSVFARDRTAGQDSYREVQWGLSSTHWTHQLLTPGHVYEYYVVSVTSVQGDASDTVRVMAGGPRPGKPSALTATPGSHSVKLTWSAVSGAQSYTVYGRDVTAGQGWRAVQWGLTGTSWTQTILQDGHTYSYYVVAVRGYLEGASSPVASAVPYTPPPAAPTGVDARLGSTPGTITISWNAVPGAESYTVYLSVSGREDTSFRPVQWNIKGTSWTQQYVEPYRRHLYYVTAVADGAASSPSDRAAVMWAPAKPYRCNDITAGSPNRVGVDSKGTLGFQWNVSSNSIAWGFKLSPQLIALGDNGRAPAITTAWFTTNGSLDNYFYKDIGETVDYWFHGFYAGPGGRGLRGGDEFRLEVSVEFVYYVRGVAGRAIVSARDCYQLMAY